MSDATTYDDANDAKASMDHIYDQPDPRAYFRELEKLDYVIPGQAKPIFETLIEQRRLDQDGAVHVLDLGCSYGVNAALLKHDLSMSALYEHWTQDVPATAPPETVIAHDRRYFAGLDEQADIEVIGLDVAEAAVNFAEETGLLDEGLTINLETETLPADATAELAQVDLVTSTGCVGYVTERSFEQLLPAVTQGRAPWIGNFVLRMFPFDTIAETLADWGYITEKLVGRTFVQRRFATSDEQAQVLDQLAARGIDPTGQESEGHLLAEFYLSRPRADAAKWPIEALLPA